MICNNYSQVLSSGVRWHLMDSGYSSALLCLATHVVRSLIDWTSKDQLEIELSQLRVEVHRAKELVSSFNTVLEACERSNGWLRFTNRSLGLLIFGILIVICCAGWAFVWRTYRTAVDHKPGEIPQPQPLIVAGPSAPPRTGPGKPSQRARVRELTQ